MYTKLGYIAMTIYPQEEYIVKMIKLNMWMPASMKKKATAVAKKDDRALSQWIRILIAKELLRVSKP